MNSSTVAGLGLGSRMVEPTLGLLCFYTDDVEAARAADTLERHGIPCVAHHEHEIFNPAFTLRSSFNAIRLFVLSTSESRAREILGLANTPAFNADTTTYLADWSQSELLEITARPDEWNEETVRAAEELLHQHHVDVTTGEKRLQHRQRLLDIRTPKHGHPAWMALAFVSILTGGVPGILVAMGYRYLRDRDPDGNVYYIYHERTRLWMGVAMVLGIMSAIAWFAFMMIW